MNAEKTAGIVSVLFVLVVVFSVVIAQHKKNKQSKEDPIEIIKKENEKLIIEVEHLDSLKDAEIIEVQNLDDDSTVKLFYKLIRE